MTRVGPGVPVELQTLWGVGLWIYKLKWAIFPFVFCVVGLEALCTVPQNPTEVTHSNWGWDLRALPFFFFFFSFGLYWGLHLNLKWLKPSLPSPASPLTVSKERMERKSSSQRLYLVPGRLHSYMLKMHRGARRSHMICCFACFHFMHEFLTPRGLPFWFSNYYYVQIPIRLLWFILFSISNAMESHNLLCFLLFKLIAF